jgi:hypothetical protein
MAFGFVYCGGGRKAGSGRVPRWNEMRRAYRRWKLKRLQRKRFGDTRTLH